MNMKAVVGGLLVVFVLFYVVTSPDHAANVFHGGWHVTVNVAHGISRFVDKLSN